jgi:hypothetical protein
MDSASRASPPRMTARVPEPRVPAGRQSDALSICSVALTRSDTHSMDVEASQDVAAQVEIESKV